MTTIMVRYETSSREAADTNAALIRAVFEELRARAPAGFRHASHRTEDGLVPHIANEADVSDA